ncbi:MAG: TonB-dependent receptor [Flavobacteriales bacterium]|jgi:hypothetical protein|nr:TonB-dependent receptor [Flavobacteriales bacterium]
MTTRIMKLRLLYITLLISAIATAQSKEKDTLNTEVINVVKAFNPSVSDAFKITRNPKLEQDSIVKHKSFTYKIFSVPVASTFKPKQGVFVGLKPNRLKSIYNNFISAGFGNNNTPLVEAFVHSNTSGNNDFGAFLNIISSDGGINNSVLDDAYSDVKFDAYYKQYQDNFDWQINSGVRFQKYNWYGISPLISSPSSDIIASINPKQSYFNFYAGGKIDYFNSAFQGTTFEYNFLSDDYDTSENYIYTTPKFAFPISSEYLVTTVSLGYLDGKFNRGFNDVSPISYQFFNVGFHPNLEVLRKDLSFNLGVKLYYSSATAGQEESKFFAYPNITASYKINSGTLTAFAGVTGDLIQNTYNDFVNENNFVSPTLNIKRTDQQYNAYFGIKGIQNNINYQLKASYKSEKNKALFVLNPVKEINLTNRAYEFGNSFDVVYDDVNTFTFTAEAEVNFSKQLDFGGDLTVNSYSVSNQQEAWNLPKLKASVFAKYTYKKWFAKTMIYIVGERKGQISHQFPTFDITTPNIVSNTAYVDLNINGGYNFSDRLTAFAKFNNILGENYQDFTNFEVQGFQALAGITYKFDF